MAKVQIGITVGGNIKQYQFLSTDSEDLYPDATECGYGSKMEIIDATTGAVTGFKEFSTVGWGSI